jgi:hypothetical protein
MDKKQVLWSVLLVFTLLAGCSQETEHTPEPTHTPLPPPLSITYCDINPSDVCLEGFGLDIEDRLLVLLTVDDRTYADIYIRADSPDGEILLECQPSEDFPENIYCLGEPFSEGDLLKLNLHAKRDNKLLAIGVFDVFYTSLPQPDVVFETDVTPSPTEEPSYPNPSYPNPTYPNPTPGQ